MDNRFDFISDKFSRLAHFGKRAEETIRSDYNLCLVNLGRLAEAIIDLLSGHFNIAHEDYSYSTEIFINGKIITQEIADKINALLEVKDDAVNHEYNSKMSCERLMQTAQELCSWFMNTYGRSKFDFLENLYHTSENSFPLKFIAEAGRDSEKNLYTNTRYSLICLGDIGEFIVDFILTRKNFQLGNSEMLLKLNTLYKNKYLSRTHYEILNNLRIIRNKAVHRRTYSQEEGIKILANILPLCEWVFVSSLSPGDLIRCVINSVNNEGLTTSISENITGTASRNEIPEDEFANFHEGNIAVLKVIRSEDGKILLGFNDSYNNPWVKSESESEPVKIIHDSVNVLSDSEFLKLCRTGNDSEIIKAIKKGANVNARDSKGSTALIIASGCCSEDVIMLMLDHNADKNATNNEGKRAYDYAVNNRRLKNSHAVKLLKPEGFIDDHEFLELCRTGKTEDIIKAITNGANVNSYSKTSQNSALIFAANSQPVKVISRLVNNGAKVNASNRKGNTPLIEAVKNNTPDVIEELLKHKADIHAVNKAGHDVLFYALRNRRLRGSEVLKLILRKRFFTLCMSGTPQMIKQALEAGINVNSRNQSGNTALIYAACYNSPESVNLLLDSGADAAIKNISGARAVDYARRNIKLVDSEALKRLGGLY